MDNKNDELIYATIESVLACHAKYEANLGSEACRKKISDDIHMLLKSNFIFVSNDDFAKFVELKEFMKKKVEELDGKY